MPNIIITHIKGRLPGYGESHSLVTTIRVSPKGMKIHPRNRLCRSNYGIIDEIKVQ